MIIYRENIGNFITQCMEKPASRSIGSIISDDMRRCGIGYFGPSQVTAWDASLPEMASVFQKSEIDPDIDVAVEYKLVQSRDRIDFLVIGNDEEDHKRIKLHQLSRIDKGFNTKLLKAI